MTSMTTDARPSPRTAGQEAHSSAGTDLSRSITEGALPVVRQLDVDGVDLCWLPLGAGGHCVRWNGRAYERLAAARQHRVRCDLYHSALLVHCDGTTYAVEMGPVWNVDAVDRGVLLEGPVGARALGRLRAFRYEVRCWPGGSIPDLAEAVGAPHRVSRDREQALGVLRALPQVPSLTWGRDELGAGDMWNSNSVVSWVLACTGHDMRTIVPPAGGRAPGWSAGLRLAERQAAQMRSTRSACGPRSLWRTV